MEETLMPQKRIRYTVRWNALRHEWAVARANVVVKAFSTKARAVTFARSAARKVYETVGRDTQLTVFKRNGTIDTEYTYGHDPRKTKG
jgi:hypothetical protein